jgi:hypothetical protein
MLRGVLLAQARQEGQAVQPGLAVPLDRRLGRSGPMTPATVRLPEVLVERLELVGRVDQLVQMGNLD